MPPLRESASDALSTEWRGHNPKFSKTKYTYIVGKAIKKEISLFPISKNRKRRVSETGSGLNYLLSIE